MKKFYSFLVAAVLLMGATSCQKEATADAGAADNVEFVASIAGGRTELDDRKVMWNDSDNIRIFTLENFAGTVFNSNIEEEVTATAKFTTTQSFTASNNGYLAIYPETANTGNATCENGVWSIPVNIQGWNQNPVNYPIAFEQNAFMVAFSGDNQLSFKAATALLKIKNIDNSQAGEIHFSGDILGGEATLLYDTNTAEISYTLGNGDSMVQYNFPEQNGETIYIPIYPGTVTGFEVYGDDYRNPLVTYNKTITFQAGVIYDLDLDNAPISGGNNSPYSLYYGGEEFIPMTIENGFHVAKNVRFAEYGYWIMEGQSTFYEVSGNITMGTWMELVQGMNTGIIFEGDYADFYMTEDASMLCIVPAGTPFENLPALPTYEPSPYYLFNMDTRTLTPMIIKDGYHFAKKVDNSDEGYAVVTEDMSVQLGFTAEWAVPGVWYKSGAFDGTTYKTLPIASYPGQPASVYLSADAEFLCVSNAYITLPAVPAKSTYEIRGSHNNWANGGAAATPMYDNGDYAVAYGVSIAANGEFKFVNGSTWIGGNGTTNMEEWNGKGDSNIVVPTAGVYDIYYSKTKSAFLLLPAGATEIPDYNAPVKANCLYLKPNNNWKNDGAHFVALFCNGTKGEAWIKMKPVGINGYYEVEIPGTLGSGKEYKNVLFLRVDPSKTTYNWNNGSVWNQTNDLTVATGMNAYTVTEGAWSNGGGSWSAITEY